MRLLTVALTLLSWAVLAQEFRLGSPVTDFQVRDPQGNSVSYAALKGDVTVVVFVSTLCPVSNAYEERMNALYTSYGAQGVHFIFVNANRNETATMVAEHARSHRLQFPVYQDVNNAAADLFGAQVTPETFVMDRTGTMRYHGSIDDSQNEARIHARGLRMALDAVLAGKPVAHAETKAFGCTIKRHRPTT